MAKVRVKSSFADGLRLRKKGEVFVVNHPKSLQHLLRTGQVEIVEEETKKKEEKVEVKTKEFKVETKTKSEEDKPKRGRPKKDK